MKPKYCGVCGKPNKESPCASCQFSAHLPTITTEDRFVKIETDIPTEVKLLGVPEQVQCHYQQRSWLAYEMPVLHDGKDTASKQDGNETVGHTHSSRISN